MKHFVCLFEKLCLLELLGRSKLVKLKRKNKGNSTLHKAVDKLILDIENANWKHPLDIRKVRPDADCVHSDGFYFFDIYVHRTMVLIVFEENEATVIWVGSHAAYSNTFKGNKSTIEKWLRNQQLI